MKSHSQTRPLEETFDNLKESELTYEDDIYIFKKKKCLHVL